MNSSHCNLEQGNIRCDVNTSVAEEGADLITFTSGSTVDHFFALGLDWPEGCVAGSIGPVTSSTLRKHGMPPAFEANPHDIPGLVKAILKHFGRK